MSSKIQTITDMLRGSSHMSYDGMRAYHDAKTIRDALRKRSPAERLSAIRKALNRYTVTAWLTEDGRIELRDGARREVLS